MPASDYKREYQRKWYANNRERLLVERSARIQNLANRLNEYKAARGCETCGEADFRCLDFHHRNPDEKVYEIAAAKRSLSWEKMLVEVEKCMILCANCHRKHHYQVKV